MPYFSRVWIALCLPLSAVLTTPAPAYNPPVDTAGPITVRIEGPKVVERIDEPLAIQVIVENQSDASVEGSLRLGVIDDWETEPAGRVSFSVGAKGKTSLPCRVVMGEGTYSAHYPIHAVVEFEHGGKAHTAHPILILEAELPRRPRFAAPIAWEPVELAADARLALWRLPIRRAVIQQFGQDAETTPTGWSGSHAENRGSSSVGSYTLDGDRREAVHMHPPWHGGRVGTVLTEFPLVLPDCRPIRLNFAHGVTRDGSGDGVTFRVRVAPLDAPDGTFGEVVFERHSAAKTWQSAAADLSRFAGRSIRLQFESHPGPAKNTGWDASYWAEPMLTAGTPANLPPLPPTDESNSRLLGRLAADDTSAPWTVRLWPGRRGLLDAVVGFARDNQQLHFRGFRVRVLDGRIDDAASPIVLLGADEEVSNRGTTFRHRFQSHRGRFDLVGRMWVESGGLKVKFHLENTPKPQPWEAFWIQDVAIDTWDQPVEQVYAGHGNVVRRPGPYRLTFGGHRLATSFVGFDFQPGLALLQAADLPPDALEVDPVEMHCSLHGRHDTTFTLIPARSVWKAVRTYRDSNGLKPADGVHKVAGRFVFDLWGGRYAESREALRRSFAYGLTDAMVVWHNWQRWGYDYRLPEIYPANPHWGTHEEFVELCAACKQAGVIFAPHDNYIDFYPDAEGFSYEKRIAFSSDGRPVKAWLNEGRDARSYRYRADAIEPFLIDNVRKIQRNLAPTGYFIDVWSSVRPYDYWTADGRFVDSTITRDTWARHFAWIRETLGDDAPQISESGHDQLIGYLDGAQTNHLRIGNQIPDHRYTWSALDWDCADAERTPWFDVAHHDRFILHGAGYESRYRAGLDRRMHGMVSDDYIATEVLTGHPGMVSRPFGRDVVRKYWLIGHLMRVLALRTIERVEYVNDDLHRQHVVWSDGGEVWVNRGKDDWPIADTTLPPFGFLARVPTEKGLVEASITRREGLIVEQARSPEELYVNGREPGDRRHRIALSVGGATLRDKRRVELPLSWQLEDPVPEGYRQFLHFVDAAGDIIFQGSYDPALLTGGRTGRVDAHTVAYLPEGIAADVEYELRMGFYRPDGGRRLELAGPDDGEARIVIGTLQVKATPEGLTSVEFTAKQTEPDPFLARQNLEGKPIDFGPVTTAGGCRLSRDGQRLVVTPLPSEKGPAPRLLIHWEELPWELPRPTHVEAIDEAGQVMGREAVERDGEALVVECEPGVFGYRLGS